MIVAPENRMEQQIQGIGGNVFQLSLLVYGIRIIGTGDQLSLSLKKICKNLPGLLAINCFNHQMNFLNAQVNVTCNCKIFDERISTFKSILFCLMLVTIIGPWSVASTNKYLRSISL